ncbi:small terminase subunit [Ahniella affigens]|uniref:Small terminase subunit n=1 Tax=Ahniella affigens TaxID=2021234 RepID=A0A2P1PSV0_9GAMM|nr:phage protein Gp27 family protein [Ahniella affigens]AVP97914.1 small terminase subunit [Ahniella affigens]
MPRKSSIDRAPETLKKRIDAFMRKNNATLDQMREALAQEFGAEHVPSRSALHRYQQNFEEVAGRMREIDAASRTLVSELGEDIGERSAELLSHAVTTLVADQALRANQNDSKVTIDEARKLAIAARHAIEAKKLSRTERQAIERDTRERMAAEQKAKLATMEKKGGIDAETLRKIREEVYGIR